MEPAHRILEGQVAVILGGTGVLGEALVKGLALAGARVVLVGRSKGKLDALAQSVGCATYVCDASQSEDLEAISKQVAEDHGAPRILLSAIGGNLPKATLPSGADFFSLDASALREVVDLNLFSGAILPILSFGATMAEGSIITVGSVSADLPLSRVGGYGAAKAAVTNFTRWAAVELGRRTGGKLRVNAIQPGFFITEQNRALLTHPDGTFTERGQSIVQHTPSGRFGDPEDLVGALLWLASDASRFVTGAVIPVDGGFTGWWGV